MGGLATRAAFVLLVALAVNPPMSAARHGPQRFFRSPSGNISCEIDLFSATSRRAYCQTWSPPANVTLFPDGHVEECFGVKHECLGNPPIHDRNLPYGDSVALGPFQYASLASGVRCDLTRT